MREKKKIHKNACVSVLHTVDELLSSLLLFHRRLVRNWTLSVCLSISIDVPFVLKEVALSVRRDAEENHTPLEEVCGVPGYLM